MSRSKCENCFIEQVGILGLFQWAAQDVRTVSISRSECENCFNEHVII